MSAKIADIWEKFIPLRTEVRKTLAEQQKNEESSNGQAIIDQYRGDNSHREWQEMRNHIVAQYYYLVQNVAENMAKKIKEVQQDALASMGVDGLYDAVDGFDPDEHDVKFETYAVYRIRGSILDAIRREDWVPRLVRSRAKKLTKKRDEMESKFGRKVADEEMAEEMGITVEEYRKLIESSSLRQVQSLNSTYVGRDSDNGTGEEMAMIDCIADPTTPEPLDAMMQQELISKLFGKNFTPLERKIIFMYYYEGRSMKEIATELKLSESRVSQKNTEIIQRLKEKIERNPDYFGPKVLALLEPRK